MRAAGPLISAQGAYAVVLHHAHQQNSTSAAPERKTTGGKNKQWNTLPASFHGKDACTQSAVCPLCGRKMKIYSLIMRVWRVAISTIHRKLFFKLWYGHSMNGISGIFLALRIPCSHRRNSVLNLKSAASFPDSCLLVHLQWCVSAWDQGLTCPEFQCCSEVISSSGRLAATS